MTRFLHQSLMRESAVKTTAARSRQFVVALYIAMHVKRSPQGIHTPKSGLLTTMLTRNVGWEILLVGSLKPLAAVSSTGVTRPLVLGIIITPRKTLPALL